MPSVSVRWGSGPVLGWVGRFGRTVWRKTPLSRDVRCGRCLLIPVGVCLLGVVRGGGTGEGLAPRSGVASCGRARWHQLRGLQCGRGCSLVFRFSGAGVNMGPCGLKSGHP